MYLVYQPMGPPIICSHRGCTVRKETENSFLLQTRCVIRVVTLGFLVHPSSNAL